MNQASSLLLAFVFFSCTSVTFENKEELTSYVFDKENGLKKRWQSNGMSIEVVYKPQSLLICQDIHSNTSEDDIKKLKDNYNDKLYFSLSISKNDRDIESYFPGDESLINKLNSGLYESINVIGSSGARYNLVDYIYTRLYSTYSGSSFMLIFNREELLREYSFRIVINDKYLNIDAAEFSFYTKNLLEVPKLIVNEVQI